MTTQHIQHFFHPVSGTISYVVSDDDSHESIVIDPVADYDVESGKIGFQSADKILDYIEQHGLHVTAILETHVHADHLTASFYLSECLDAPIHVAEGVKQVYAEWKDELALSDMYHFERFLLESDELDFGDSHLEVMNTPGHTPSDLTYKIGNAVFVGDSLFYHGTGRADFPGGSAEKMYRSISKLYALEDNTQVFLCHNYPKSEAELIHTTTIGEEKHDNVFMTEATTEAQFIDKRQQRDASLAAPKLINPALTYNLTATLAHRH